MNVRMRPCGSLNCAVILGGVCRKAKHGDQIITGERIGCAQSKPAEEYRAMTHLIECRVRRTERIKPLLCRMGDHKWAETGRNERHIFEMCAKCGETRAVSVMMRNLDKLMMRHVSTRSIMPGGPTIPILSVLLSGGEVRMRDDLVYAADPCIRAGQAGR